MIELTSLCCQRWPIGHKWLINYSLIRPFEILLIHFLKLNESFTLLIRDLLSLSCNHSVTSRRDIFRALMDVMLTAYFIPVPSPG